MSYTCNRQIGDDSEPSDSHPEEGVATTTDGGSSATEQHDSDKQETADGESLPPLHQQSDISTSQIDFFKMLDEKIENGPDYEEDEIERDAERQRLQRLLHEWLRRPMDTQRFPTAYQPCPPSRQLPPAQICPHPSLYASTRAYVFGRAISVEAAEPHYYETYGPIYPNMDPRIRSDQPYPQVQDPYGSIPMEPQAYARMVAAPAAYVPHSDTQDFYTRRAMLAKTSSRAMSFDANPYSRAMEVPDQYGLEHSGMPDCAHRGREHHYSPYGGYMPPPDSSMLFKAGHDQVQYISRPPPREIPPLQGAPGPPHGSPRPLTVRLPTSAMWRRPRGPVTELA